MPENRIATQQPHKRIKNFSEVAIGITKKQAIENAKLFLQREGNVEGEPCPLETDIFAFLHFLARGDIQSAIDKVREKDVLPGITSRLTKDPYAETQVFNKDGEPVSIRELIRFASDAVIKRSPNKKNNIKNKGKVAVVGSGPSGLTAAVELTRLGFSVTVYEALHKIGGTLCYGYPEFRIPQKIVDQHIQYISSLGVEFVTNCLVGHTYSMEDFFDLGFHAVYLSTGAGIPSPLKLPGEDLHGVMYGDELLARVSLMNANLFPKYETMPNIGQKVVVIGGGNTAMDCARTCVRLGAAVNVVVHAAQDELKVRPIIVQHTKEEGVQFETLTRVVELLGDESGCVSAVKCQRLDYADLHATGDWKVVEVENSDFIMDADTVIVAIGHEPNNLFAKTMPNLKLNKDGTIWTKKDSSMTSIEGVFVGGNVADGPGPFVWAMLSAKDAVEEIDVYLKQKE